MVDGLKHSYGWIGKHLEQRCVFVSQLAIVELCVTQQQTTHLDYWTSKVFIRTRRARIPNITAGCEKMEIGLISGTLFRLAVWRRLKILELFVKGSTVFVCMCVCLKKSVSRELRKDERDYIERVNFNTWTTFPWFDNICRACLFVPKVPY